MAIPESSIFQPAKTHLAPVWTTSGFLENPIKQQILDKVYSLFNKEQVKGLYVLGSIVGYKWNDLSDLDVNIALHPLPEGFLKTKGLERISGDRAVGTKHKIGFFVSEWSPTLIDSLRDAPLGAYSILDDRWLSLPPPPESFRHPLDEFVYELHGAKIHNRILRQKLQAWKNTVGISKELVWNELQSLVDKVDSARKDHYLSGWGIPRYSPDNVTFKYLDRGESSKAFQVLKDLNSEKRKARSLRSKIN